MVEGSSLSLIDLAQETAFGGVINTVRSLGFFLDVAGTKGIQEGSFDPVLRKN